MSVSIVARVVWTIIGLAGILPVLALLRLNWRSRRHAKKSDRPYNEATLRRASEQMRRDFIYLDVCITVVSVGIIALIVPNVEASVRALFSAVMLVQMVFAVIWGGAYLDYKDSKDIIKMIIVEDDRIAAERIDEKNLAKIAADAATAAAIAASLTAEAVRSKAEADLGLAKSTEKLAEATQNVADATQNVAIATQSIADADTQKGG